MRKYTFKINIRRFKKTFVSIFYLQHEEKIRKTHPFRKFMKGLSWEREVELSVEDNNLKDAIRIALNIPLGISNHLQ